MVVFLLIHSRILLAFWAVRKHCSYSVFPPPTLTSFSPQDCSQSTHHAACIHVGIALAHVNALLKLHEVCMHPALKLVESLRMVSVPFSVLITPQGLASSANFLNFTVHVTNKYLPQRNAIHHWSPLGHKAIDCNSLSGTMQPIPYPQTGPSTKSTSPQFRDKDDMCVAMSNDLHKPKQTMSVALPLSTKLAVNSL